MKYLSLLLALGLSVGLHAQNPGCDGVRYKDDVFATVKKTTVKYTTAPSYFFNQTIDLYVDVYEPEGDTLSERPAIVVAHGGTFIFGNKQDMQSWCEIYARKGYVAASIQYRLYPVIPFGFPDSVKILDAAMKAVGDMKAAVRYLHEDANGANQFRVDTDHIFIGGYSAGAVAALHAAYIDSNTTVPPFIQTVIANNGGLNGNSGNSQNLSYPFNPRAVLNLSGGLYRSNWLLENDVPVASLHGTSDGTVPYTSGLAANLIYLEGSSRIKQQADQVGVWNTLVTVNGGGHTDIYSEQQYAPFLATYVTVSADMMENITCPLSADAEPGVPAVDWSVFPNPATDRLYISVPEQYEVAETRVYDASGKLVKTQGGLSPVDLSALKPGWYVVQLVPANPTSGTGILSKSFFRN